MGKVLSRSTTPHSALSASSPPPPELQQPWRKVAWGKPDMMLKELEDFKPNLKPLRILLHGPVGAGKSCFINSVQRILLNRNFIGVQEQPTRNGTSDTLEIKTHKLKKCSGGHYPFVFTDLMGLEAENLGGIIPDDIIKALKGHILDGYKFNPLHAITKDSLWYKENPKASDKVHCLVTILPADSISRMSDKVIEKMKTIREKVKKLKIPQVIVLTKVDQACQIVDQDLKKLYHSRKIKEKVELCSIALGISLNSIYPVKNYHAEITQDDDTDTIILMALRDIVNFANDCVEEMPETDNE